MTQSPENAVRELLAAYHDGLYHLDTAKLREVFSPSAHYATIRDGALLVLTLDEYLPQLERRTAPVEDGAPEVLRIVSIEFVGEHTAVAVVESSMFGFDYTDVLSLLRIDGRWRIQSKVFEGVRHPAVESV